RDQLLGRLAHRGLQEFSSGYNLVIHDEPRATTATVRAAAARLRVQHGGVRAIYVDYLQILADPGEPEHIRVGRISRELKAIAREFDVPVIAMSQLNRLSESREDRRPRLSDLRDSGAIEQDADIVLGLFRPRLNSADMSILVLKNRHGRAGDEVSLFFDLDSVSVGDE
ncbi:MAG TPA: DnaB-like helicase C-terminal domain-containing protein, partial [bacterium]|nr:DnaB-like helicase C-terminal domain-containing protein [bacterium]